MRNGREVRAKVREKFRVFKATVRCNYPQGKRISLRGRTIDLQTAKSELLQETKEKSLCTDVEWATLHDPKNQLFAGETSCFSYFLL